MKLLVSKREANLPLFLKLACEELRVFGVFEEVSMFIFSCIGASDGRTLFMSPVNYMNLVVEKNFTLTYLGSRHIKDH